MDRYEAMLQLMASVEAAGGTCRAVSKQTTQAHAWEIRSANAKVKGGANSRKGEALGTAKHAHEVGRKENKAARFEKRNGSVQVKPKYESRPNPKAKPQEE